MPDHNCPPSGEILTYTISIIVSVAMIWYIHLRANFWDINRVSLPALLFLAGFCIIFLYSSAKLIVLLFPSRKKTCPACRLIAKIIEIEQVTGVV